jgi:hypothetical protein
MQAASTGEATEYQFPHFKRHLVLEDRSFAGGIRPDEPMPDFDLPTTNGRRVRKVGLHWRTTTAAYFGSFSDP